MNARSGQVALYLALVLVAIAFLVLMNLGVYLGVSARNATMNSGDAASLAVAHYQGELINRIGEWNLEHLRSALEGDAEKCAELTRRQLRTSFLDPLEGISIGNAAAKENGCDQSDRMKGILADHARDVRLYYATNPDVYPEPWEGAWEEYAQHLEIAISNGIWAGPDNVDFLDAATGHLLLNQGFYQAIASRNWCWFHFNAESTLKTYTGHEDWGPLPIRHENSFENSEIFSLHVKSKRGSILDVFTPREVVNLLERFAGDGETVRGGSPWEESVAECPVTYAVVTNSALLRDNRQTWYFLGEDRWREWTEISAERGFPVLGSIKPEYDVRGCAAICRRMYSPPPPTEDLSVK